MPDFVLLHDTALAVRLAKLIDAWDAKPSVTELMHMAESLNDDVMTVLGLIARIRRRRRGERQRSEALPRAVDTSAGQAPGVD